VSDAADAATAATAAADSPIAPIAAAWRGRRSTRAFRPEPLSRETLTELFAYLTDVMLFRLNTVTDANRTAFLRLLNGPDWQAPTDHAGLDAELRRTVNLLRSSDRAVTASDYESLVLAADPAGRIARARCVPADAICFTATGSATFRRTGWPRRATFRMAMSVSSSATGL